MPLKVKIPKRPPTPSENVSLYPNVTVRKGLSSSRRTTLYLREERCKHLPKPTDTVWFVPKATRILDEVLDNTTKYLQLVGERQGSDVLVMPRTTFDVAETDEFTVETDEPALRSVIVRIFETIGSMAIGVLSVHIYKPPSKGVVYPDPVMHRLTFCVTNQGGAVQAYLLDANGTIERKHDGNWAPRTRIAVETYVRTLMDLPPFEGHFLVQAVHTPHVNFTPSEHSANVLKDLDVHEVNTERAMCRHFAFMFLVELLCTSQRGTDSEHIFRFLHLDVLRRPFAGDQKKRDITENERAELLLYIRALALGVYKLATGKGLPNDKKAKVRRYIDDTGARRLKVVPYKLSSPSSAQSGKKKKSSDKKERR